MLLLSRLRRAKSTAASFLKVSFDHQLLAFSQDIFPPSMADIKQILILSTTAEDNMNVQLKDITVTARDGRVSHLDQVYIRGSHVRFFIVPDMLRYVPSFHISKVALLFTRQLHGFFYNSSG